MNRKKIIIPSIVTIIILSLIIFLIPIEPKNETGFIISFTYYLISNLTILFLISKNTSLELKKDILNVSTIYVYILLTIISTIFLFLSKVLLISTPIILILLLVLILISFISLYFLINGISFINSQEEKISIKTQNVNNWKTEIEIILNNCEKEELKKELIELYELIKYMDPISNDITMELDSKINQLIEQLKEDTNSKLIKEIYKIVNERKVLISNNK